MMKRFYFIWVGVFILIVIFSFMVKKGSTTYHGIAETREIVVNSEYPVEIKKVHIVQGQAIELGDTLIELKRPELEIRISEVKHQLNELKAEKVTKADVSYSKIRELKAKQAEKVNEIKAEIKQLKSQYELNRQLTAELKSIKNHKNVDNLNTNNPIKLKIANLEKELNLALSPSQIKIDQLKNELSSTEKPLVLQMVSLETEFELLLEEKNKLTICARINGVIGSVNFKEGENVSPFAPILTLHTKSPSYVKGYIHEDVYHKVSVRDSVFVISIADDNNHYIGEVVGVGSRIVEYPVRLRKRPDIMIWGREVLIRIPQDNNFLLGEKVLIRSYNNFQISNIN